MSNLYPKNPKPDNSKNRIKFKKLRNKDSYMNAFLERRKKAADFALNDKFRTDYNYQVPPYILNIENELMILKKKNKNKLNSIRNKSEFYKTYNTLKYSLSHKSNNSSQNKLIIEKENNKYYLSQEIPENKKIKKIFVQNGENFEQDLINQIISNNNDKIDKNKKYNNIKHHTINVSSSKNKTKNNDNNLGKYNSWKNLQIQKISSLTNYDNNDNNKKENKKNVSNSTPFLVMSNQYEYEFKNNYKIKDKNEIMKNKNPNQILINKNENNVGEKIKYESNYNNIYYEGLHNHHHYESSPRNKNNLSEKNIQIKDPQNYQLKSLSEPKNIYEKTKSIYPQKGYTDINNNNYINNNINNKIYKYNYNNKTKIYEISPIKTHYRYDYKDYNDDKIYDSQTLNSNNLNSKSDTNINIILIMN